MSALRRHVSKGQHVLTLLAVTHVFAGEEQQVMSPKAASCVTYSIFASYSTCDHSQRVAQHNGAPTL